jgi:cytochrome oxidase Cu insertion factor (SCO1/SenC/PrrC family)
VLGRLPHAAILQVLGPALGASLRRRVKTRLMLAPIGALLVAGAAAGALVIGSGDEGRAYRGSVVPRGVQLPPFELRNYTGEIVRSNDLRGRVVLATFLETQCKEACPIVASYLVQGLDRLESKERARTVAVAISTHPVDDTPDSVRAFLRNHRAENELAYLIGSEQELRPVWEAFSIASAFDSGDASIHSAPVRIFDRSGEWVSTLHAGSDLTPENLPHDVTVALE